MSEHKNQEAMRSVAREEFLRDPANVLRRAEIEGPIVIMDSSGNPTAIVSAPREERAGLK